eukprot:5549726-Amphidinium_carterae.1
MAAEAAQLAATPERSALGLDILCGASYASKATTEWYTIALPPVVITAEALRLSKLASKLSWRWVDLPRTLL